MIRAQGLALMFAGVVRTFVDDEDDDNARTMAALDRALASGERWSGLLDDLCRLAPRPGRRRRRRMREDDEVAAAYGCTFTTRVRPCNRFFLSKSGEHECRGLILNIDDVEFRAWGHNAGWPVGMNAKEDYQAKLGDIGRRLGAQKARLQSDRRAAAQAGLSDAQSSRQRGNVFHSLRRRRIARRQGALPVARRRCRLLPAGRTRDRTPDHQYVGRGSEISRGRDAHIAGNRRLSRVRTSSA